MIRRDRFPDPERSKRQGAREPRADRRAEIMRMPDAIIICGEELCANRWLVDSLSEQRVRLDYVPVPAHLRDAITGKASVALIGTSGRNGGPLLDVVRSLGAVESRKLLLLVWPAAWSLAPRFIAAGVSDFLKVPASVAELQLRIALRAVDAERARGYALGDDDDLPEANDLVRELSQAGWAVRFSEREYLLYKFLAARLGTPVSRGEILTAIWHRSADAESSNIVDVYVRYLRVKLAAFDPTLTITTIRGVGYMMERAPREGRDRRRK